MWNGFKRETFDLLSKYRENPKTPYKKEEFDPLVRDGFKYLMNAVFPFLKESLPEYKLSRKNALSGHASRQNDMFFHFWAAVYREEQLKKKSDMQLFYYITDEFFRFGIAFGNEISSQLKSHIDDKLVKHNEDFKQIFKNVSFQKELELLVCSSDGSLIEKMDIDHFTGKENIVKKHGITIAFHISPEEVISLGKNLSNQLIEGLGELLELYRFLDGGFTLPSNNTVKSASKVPVSTFDDKCDDEIDSYDINSLDKESFISRYYAEEILNLLHYKKNIILQGPPGVGKTFLAKRLAYVMQGSRKRNNISMIQFHESYSYEDFIQGLRPDHNGNFQIRDGIFYRFCRKASKKPHEPFFFIIDEINRGNLSKIFGELMLLLEKDKRGSDNAIELTYSTDNSPPFYVPDNIYIIGTMNTADRSLSLVDYALRRRFAFLDLCPEFRSEKFKLHLLDSGASSGFVRSLEEKIEGLNSRIRNDQRNLGPGFEIGHSYFCADSVVNNWHDRLEKIIKYEIAPLLVEYWFDSPEKAQEEVIELLG